MGQADNVIFIKISRITCCSYHQNVTKNIQNYNWLVLQYLYSSFVIEDDGVVVGSCKHIRLVWSFDKFLTVWSDIWESVSGWEIILVVWEMTGETAGVLADSLHLSLISDTAIAMSQTHPPPASYSIPYICIYWRKTNSRLGSEVKRKSEEEKRYLKSLIQSDILRISFRV